MKSISRDTIYKTQLLLEEVQQIPKWLDQGVLDRQLAVCFSWARVRTENLTPVYYRLRSNRDHLGSNNFEQILKIFHIKKHHCTASVPLQYRFCTA